MSISPATIQIVAMIGTNQKARMTTGMAMAMRRIAFCCLRVILRASSSCHWTDLPFGEDKPLRKISGGNAAVLPNAVGGLSIAIR